MTTPPDSAAGAGPLATQRRRVSADDDIIQINDSPATPVRRVSSRSQARRYQALQNALPHVLLNAVQPVEQVIVEDERRLQVVISLNDADVEARAVEPPQNQAVVNAEPAVVVAVVDDAPPPWPPSPPAVAVGTPATGNETAAELATSQSSSARKRRRCDADLNASLSEDQGTTCPICLDSWEISGDHRLVSLKCGHLFGDSCIRRWARAQQPHERNCPSCKSRVHLKDIRPLYARRIAAVDRTHEYELADAVAQQIAAAAQLKQELALCKLELAVQLQRSTKLEQQLAQAQADALTLAARSATSTSFSRTASSSSLGSDAGVVSISVGAAASKTTTVGYKLERDCTVQVCADPGCRVLCHARRSAQLVISAKSVLNLFPGFGVRLMDLHSQRLGAFVHMSTKQIRDLAFDQDAQLIAGASQDPVCKVYSAQSRDCHATFKPTPDRAIWSVAFDVARRHTVYFGTQNGSAFACDRRQPAQVVEEYRAPGDASPVISVCSVPPAAAAAGAGADGAAFPHGAFLVCRMQSLWCYEYESAAGAAVVATKLALTGPFVSMSYAAETNTVLVATRPPQAELVYAQLRKVGETVALQVVCRVPGSRVQPVMSRSAQLQVGGVPLVSAYMQDRKELQTWQIDGARQQQALPVEECILDLCPVYARNNTGEPVLMAALSDRKCRIYKVVVSENRW